ncbi:hypothetical protein C8R43DRAFT_960594 [Mycena crocata]|nr:hypothetical protein C8R43DRAFT_960594 [Mycena crocata]
MFHRDSTIMDSVIREAGRAVADKLVPTDNDRPSFHYGYARARSPRPYSSSGSSHDYDSVSSGYGRRHGATRSEHHVNSDWGPSRGRSYPRYRDASPPRHHWGPRDRSPTPRYDDRYGGPQTYREQRRTDYGRDGVGRGRTLQRDDFNRGAFKHRAFESRPADDRWKRTIFPPDIRAAETDDAGHPQYPGGLEDDDDNLGIREPVGYEVNESLRRLRHVEAERRGTARYQKIVDAADSSRTGRFTDVGPVMSFAQAVNVFRWVYCGERTAMEYLKSNMTRLGTDPTLPRSVGEVTLLQHQNQAVARYKYVTSGVIAPQGKKTNAGRVYAGNVPALSQPADPIVTIAPSSDDVAPPTDDGEDIGEDVAMKDAPGVMNAIVRAYLGTASPPATDTTSVVLTEYAEPDTVGRRASKPPLTTAVRWYKAIPTNKWPKGMRVTRETWPSTPSATPWPTDVSAWFTINALVPLRGPTSLHRARFIAEAVNVLSIEGTFDRYAIEGTYVFDSLPLEHYPFDATNISAAQVVSWFVQHGIAPQSLALDALQDFARSRRNHIAGAASPVPTEFTSGFPASAKDVPAIIIRDEDLWQNLHHGAVRETVTTSYPAFPAGVAQGISASVHATTSQSTLTAA